MGPNSPRDSNKRADHRGDYSQIEPLMPLRRCEEALGAPHDYPPRSEVPLELRRWERDFPGYSPAMCEFTRGRSGESPDRCAHHAGELGQDSCEHLGPPDKRAAASLEGPVRLDPRTGAPLNPYGRTGLAGRGRLFYWGPNHAADAIITRENSATGALEIVLIERSNGAWALPGGFIDPHEDSRRAAARELREETGLQTDLSTAVKVYSGLVIDPRMTDNAWIETEAHHLHLRAPSREPSAGDDAVDAAWKRISPELVAALYASHGTMVRAALSQLAQRESELSPLARAQIGDLGREPVICSYRGLGRRIGIYGGTFDPIHLAHTAAAAAACVEANLDCVVFVPAKQNPLKSAAPGANEGERLAMVRAAIGGDERFWIDPGEMRREGVAYTIDTIKRVRADCGPDVEIALIVGGDCVHNLSRWRDVQSLLAEVQLVVVPRNSITAEEIKMQLKDFGGAAERSICTTSLELSESSTSIREGVKSGGSIAGRVAEPVADFITERGLYRDSKKEI